MSEWILKELEEYCAHEFRDLAISVRYYQWKTRIGLVRGNDAETSGLQRLICAMRDYFSARMLDDANFANHVKEPGDTFRGDVAQLMAVLAKPRFIFARNASAIAGPVGRLLLLRKGMASQLGERDWSHVVEQCYEWAPPSSLDGALVEYSRMIKKYWNWLGRPGVTAYRTCRRWASRLEAGGLFDPADELGPLDSEDDDLDGSAGDALD